MGENLLIKNLYPLLTPEAFFLIQALLGLSWIFYRIFLKGVSTERHLSLRKSYRKLLRLTLVFAVFFGVYFALSLLGEWELGWAHRLKPYFALLAFFLGLMVLIRGSRLLLLQYLFLGSMTAGVPILIVNIFSLAMTLALLVWSASHVFGIQLGPLLATSAVFSIILGLALQDTLGNIFSGIALQIDKSFEIGDWLEIVNGTQKIVGQVQEITWRSTILIGWSDEIITLPNRSIANWQISNFANGRLPILRSQSFRVDPFEDLERVRQLLLESLRPLAMIPSYPQPVCFISESNESWVNFKLVYGIQSYGKQFLVGDQVIESAMKHLSSHGIKLSPQRLSVKVQSS